MAGEPCIIAAFKIVCGRAHSTASGFVRVCPALCVGAVVDRQPKRESRQQDTLTSSVPKHIQQVRASSSETTDMSMHTHFDDC